MMIYTTELKELGKLATSLFRHQLDPVRAVNVPITQPLYVHPISEAEVIKSELARRLET